MTRTTLGIAIIMAGLLLVAAPAAWSDDKEKEANVADLAKQAKVSVEDAIKTATSNVKGQVVEAELEKKHDKTVWEVEVLGEDGKVKEVHVDAITGQIIDTEDKKMEKHEGKKKGK